MFYVFGRNSTQIAHAPTQVRCSHCQTDGSVGLHVYRHYFHVFWIPAFPLWKSSSSQCSHCKQVLKEKEFDDTLKSANIEAGRQAKTPLWTFSWLLILAALATVLTISIIAS